MIRALLHKEWRQHGGALAVLAVLVLAGWTLSMLPALLRGREMVLLDQFRTFALVYGVLAASWISHRLVTLEYRGRTQLFLEGLPVSRPSMVAVKYAVGGSVFFLLLGATTLFSILLQTLGHGFDPALSFMVMVRVGAVGWFLFNLCFLMAFAGRYRLGLWLLLLVILPAIQEFTSVRLNEVGPFGLMDQQFAFERGWPRSSALLVTVAGGGVCLFASAVLGLMREGSVAALMAETMSHREKVMVALVLGGGAFALSVLQERRQKAPFDLPGASAAHRPGVVVKVPWEVADATQRAQKTADLFLEIREYLGLPQLPPIFLVGRTDLDAWHFERGTLDEAEGVHLQANFAATGWDEDRFKAWLIREVLLGATRDRAALEYRRWILDGFSLWWIGRGRGADPLESDRFFALRACYAAPRTLPAGQIRRWLAFRERHGPDLAAAVAWSGLRALERKQGSEALHRVLQHALGRVVPVDGRALWTDGKGQFELGLADAAGMTWDKWVETWNQELDQVRPRFGAELTSLPRIQCDVRFTPLSGESRALTYRVGIQPASSDNLVWSFLHAELGPVDVEISPQAVQREQHARLKADAEELPGTLSAGARLATTASVRVESLGCEVIAGWVRHDVP